MADVDMDGDNDVFLTNYIGPSTLWLNDGRGDFTASQQDFGNSEAHDVALQDLNGDGFPDIFLLNHAAPCKVFFNGGKGNFRDSGQKLGNATGYESVDCGDIDQDGDIDFVVANSIDGVKIWLNEKHSGQCIEAGPYFEAGTTKLKLFDADLDGDLDLFTANQTTGNKL
jgi:hypothetical protein